MSGVHSNGMAMVNPDQPRTLQEQRMTAADFSTEPFIAVDLGQWGPKPSNRHRLNVTRQSVQIAVGDWMLSTFPFLRRPAEWLGRQLERWSRD